METKHTVVKVLRTTTKQQRCSSDARCTQ